VDRVKIETVVLGRCKLGKHQLILVLWFECPHQIDVEGLYPMSYVNGFGGGAFEM
jgi:hypothetical protein